MRTPWLGFGLGCALLFAAACGEKPSSRLSQHPDQSGERVRILDRQAGDDAALKMPGVMLITSDTQLLKTGASSLAQVPVHFATQSLVVVALGERSTGGHWVRISNIQRKGDTLYVQGRANQPGKEGITTQAVSFPYDAVVIARQEGVARVLSEIESVTGAEEANPFLVAPRHKEPAASRAATAPADTQPEAGEKAVDGK